MSNLEPLPCPFCGAPPKIEPWHGGGPRKRHVGCDNDECDLQPGITGSTRQRAILKWNVRAPRLQATAVRDRRIADFLEWALINGWRARDAIGCVASGDWMAEWDKFLTEHGDAPEFGGVQA